MTDTNSLVSDLLNILQQDDAPVKAEKKVKPTIVAKTEQPDVKKTPKEPAKKTISAVNTEGGFLSGIDETIKDTINAKVVIRKDLYEVFVSIKRAKQVKSVQLLLDHALEDYIKRNSENIKALLNESKTRSIL